MVWTWLLILSMLILATKTLWHKASQPIFNTIISPLINQKLLCVSAPLREINNNTLCNSASLHETNNISPCVSASLQDITNPSLTNENQRLRDFKPNKSLVQLCAFVALWLLSGSTIKAQITKDTFDLKTIEITAQIPIEQKALSRSQIDTLELKKLQTKSLAELIQATGPVFVKTYGRGSSATVSFRGTASSHTQVNWNGMNINSPMRGDIDFSLIPVYFIDEMNLLHGGSSLSQTSGGLGGSIQMNNQADWNNQLQIKYVQDIESFSTFREFLQLGIGNQKFQSSTRVFHNQSQNDFPFYNYGVLPYRDDIQENADYEKYGFLQELYYRWKNQHQISLKVWGGHSFRNLPQLMSYEGENRKEYQEDDQLRAIAKWKYFNKDVKWEVFSSFNHHKQHYFRSSAEDNFNSFNTENSSLNRFLFQLKKQEKLHIETYIDFNFHTINVDDKATEITYTKNRSEAFWIGQINYSFNEKTSAFVILRSEYYDDTFVPLIPAIGLEYQLNKKISFFLNGSRNYHKPTLNDLYWIPGGYPDLKPENAWSVDIGMKTHAEHNNLKISFELNTYQSIIDNWIIWQPSSSGAIYWEAINLRKVWARGIESQLKLHWDFHQNWKMYFSANYAYTRTSNQNAVNSVDESRGKQLIYIPIHSGNFLFDLKYKKWDWSLGNQSIGKRYTKSSNEESNYEFVLSSFTVLNTELSYTTKIKKLETRIAFRIENLLDTDYMMILWRPMPGRYYAFNLQLKWRK